MRFVRSTKQISLIYGQRYGNAGAEAEMMNDCFQSNLTALALIRLQITRTLSYQFNLVALNPALNEERDFC